MKYTCDKCKKEIETTGKEYGGYCVTEMKNLCPKCWVEYLEIKNKHNKELKGWWDNGSK